MVIWERREMLDDKTELSVTVKISDGELISVRRSDLERFLSEAGYSPVSTG